MRRVRHLIVHVLYLIPFPQNLSLSSEGARNHPHPPPPPAVMPELCVPLPSMFRAPPRPPRPA